MPAPTWVSIILTKLSGRFSFRAISPPTTPCRIPCVFERPISWSSPPISTRLLLTFPPLCSILEAISNATSETKEACSITFSEQPTLRRRFRASSCDGASHIQFFLNLFYAGRKELNHLLIAHALELFSAAGTPESRFHRILES